MLQPSPSQNSTLQRFVPSTWSSNFHLPAEPGSTQLVFVADEDYQETSAAKRLTMRERLARACEALQWIADMRSGLSKSSGTLHAATCALMPTRSIKVCSFFAWKTAEHSTRASTSALSSLSLSLILCLHSYQHILIDHHTHSQ
jgi:hypothetical protein